MKKIISLEANIYLYVSYICWIHETRLEREEWKEEKSVCVCEENNSRDDKYVWARKWERGNPCGLFFVFFAGHQNCTVNNAFLRFVRNLSHPARDSPGLQPRRDRWRATSSIQKYPQQPGDPVAQGVRKNGVMYAQSWRYIPLYAKSRGIPAINRYGR